MKIVKRILIFTLIIMALFSITNVCASDVNDATIASEDANQVIEDVNDDTISELEDQSDILESSDEDLVSMDENSWFYEDIVWYDGSYSEIDQTFLVLADDLENPENITIQLYHDAKSQVIFDDENPNEYTIQYSDCKNPIANVDLAILNNHDYEITKLTTDSNGIATYNIPFNVEEFSFCVGFWYDEYYVANYAYVDETTIYAFNWGTWHNGNWINGTDENNNEAINTEYTFAALQNMIDNAIEGSTITLENDYVYDDSFSIKGVTINKALTIDGAGHLIDALDESHIMYVNASNVVLKNIRFINGNAFEVDDDSYSLEVDEDLDYYNYEMGAAIQWYGANGKLINCYFENNTCTWDGGALYWQGNDGTIDNCVFIRNTAGYGGAIKCENGMNLQVMNSTFIENYADTGGAISWYGNHTGLVKNCTFDSNYGYMAGAGAIHADNFTMVDCTFTNNYAIDSVGGALWWYGENGLVNNTLFIDNYADEGGAVYADVSLETPRKTKFLNCIFENNHADYRGGAIYVWGNVTVESSKFTGNDAKSYGGAIYWESSNGTITKNSFTNNHAEYGGAVATCTGASNFKMSYCDFNNNNASYGGAGCIRCVLSLIENCSFTRNTAKECGGALCGGTSVNCIFENNRAGKDGDDTHEYDPQIDLGNNGRIIGERDNGTANELQNKINNAEEGSTIKLENDYGATGVISISKPITIDGNGHTIDGISFGTHNNYVVFKNIAFINCSGNYGGAIKANGAVINIIGCIFDNNEAQYGGAIYIDENCKMTITNTQFKNNFATNALTSGSGGAIYVSQSELDIINCNFTHNSVSGDDGGAICARFQSHVNIKNTIFKNNIASKKMNRLSSAYGLTDGDGGAIDIYYSYLTISDTQFIGNSAEGDGGAINEGDTIMNITNSNFTENTAWGSGGAISVNYGDDPVDISNCYFTKNKETFEGNAIYVYERNVTIHNCTFVDGNVYCKNCTVDLSDSKLIDSNSNPQNESLNNDTNNTNPNIVDNSSNSTSNNTEDIDGDENNNESSDENSASVGGSKSYDVSSFEALKSALSSNHDENVIINLKSDITLTSTFDLNPSIKTLTIKGNGKTINGYAGDWKRPFLRIENNVEVTIENIRIMNCEASYGAAIYNTGQGKLTVLNSVFENNNILRYGGAIFNSGHNSIIKNCTFINNFACKGLDSTGIVILGGAIYNDAENVTITDSIFENNYVTTTAYRIDDTTIEGGAIYIEGDNAKITGNIFIGNSADDKAIVDKYNSKGGAIYVSGGNVKITGNIFINNSAGNGAAVYTYGSNVLIDSNTFKLNNALSSNRDEPIIYMYRGGYYVDIDKSDNIFVTDTECYSTIFHFAYSGAVITNNVFNDRLNTIIETSPNKIFSSEYNENNYLVITLKDETGEVLKGISLNIDFNGIKYLTTDDNGQIKLSTNGMSPNVYNAKITFAGDDKYAESTITVKVTVENSTQKSDSEKSNTTTPENNNNNSTNSTTTPENNDNDTSSTITPENNNNQNNNNDTSSTITPENNNNNPNTNTNENTNSNTNKNTNNNASTNTNLKPKTKKATKITAKKATFKAKAKTKKYTITLKSGKKAIKKVKVYLKIKGKTYTAKTNNKGKAIFKIKNLKKKGTYKATITFKGNKNYNKVSKTVNIKIK